MHPQSHTTQQLTFVLRLACILLILCGSLISTAPVADIDDYKNIPDDDRLFLENLAGQPLLKTDTFRNSNATTVSRKFQSDLVGCRKTEVGHCPERLTTKPMVSLTYTISSDLSNETQENIRAAMDFFNNNTCLNFVEVQIDEDNATIDSFFFRFVSGYNLQCFLQYYNTSDNNSMKIGRKIFLAEKCTPVRNASQIGHIFHFVMLGLGFPYEHTRADRDNYVIIYKQNIPEEHLPSFEKESQMDPDADTYDYTSVLHPYYNHLSRGKGKFSISPKENVTVTSFGQRAVLSDVDLKKIKRKFCKKPETKPSDTRVPNQASLLTSPFQLIESGLLIVFIAILRK